MARHAIDKKVGSVKALEGFNTEGWRFEADLSVPDRLVFRRKLPE